MYSVGEVVAAVLGMMDLMHVGKACFVAHSYGECWADAPGWFSSKSL